MRKNNDLRTGPGSQSPWRLPAVLNVVSKHIRYREPQHRLIGLKIVEATEAVEIVIDTDDEFPVGALSPVLYVGEISIPHYKWVSENRYRFIAFDFQNLREGVPIFLGWPGRPETRVETRFRYRLGAPSID
ncbi:MAG: hypothetical protein DCC43_10110 [Candidatus Brocadia sp.]|jgi:hypothetical protein|uniref:Uncharacterized protein n=1 Tax=Candidatus Brocadia fulgida TaxID=380242 RepID=A0A0M2UYK6_9BACT|nr:MAG: hypothetical protein BROFUL_01730 [Candidatus Brocadia fulgida]MBV6519279.1 hypothetical protein [Candidatus Brocadia fulgida]MCE7912390.1 hypothetical protein [Candidatus Brocadia sp. AMX3]RIJ97587.1 MAG: hypothetical protein DCC43_10110 [Candidatus Brocadia sp.]